jgi:6-phosphogluconolactonase
MLALLLLLVFPKPSSGAGAALVHKSSKAEIPAALATFVAARERAALSRGGGRFTVALSGGSMPKVLGQALAGGAFSWDKWHVFYADERCVPLDHGDSNHKACQEHFFSKVPIPAAQLHPLRYEAGDERDPTAAVARYTAELAAVFAEAAAAAPAPALPQFDLVLLGMGPDGHTASLFPGHALLEGGVVGGAAGAGAPWVAGLTDSPKAPPARITLTLPVLNAAHSVAFVTAGGGKADAIRSIFDAYDAAEEEAGGGGGGGAVLPAGRVACAQEPVHWFVDDAAAAQLLPAHLSQDFVARSTGLRLAWPAEAAAARFLTYDVSWGEQFNFRKAFMRNGVHLARVLQATHDANWVLVLPPFKTGFGADYAWANWRDFFDVRAFAAAVLPRTIEFDEYVVAALVSLATYQCFLVLLLTHDSLPARFLSHFSTCCCKITN